MENQNENQTEIEIKETDQTEKSVQAGEEIPAEIQTEEVAEEKPKTRRTRKPKTQQEEPTTSDGGAEQTVDVRQADGLDSAEDGLKPIEELVEETILKDEEELLSPPPKPKKKSSSQASLELSRNRIRRGRGRGR